MTSGNLVDGDNLKRELELLIPKAKSHMAIISAYITQSGVEWLLKLVPKAIKVHLVCRLTPHDVISGATNISALQTALKAGWSVSCLHSLHAKIYSVDDEAIYAGSANLTSNGLRIYGIGNIEACLTVAPSKENIDFIQKIISSSTKINSEILNRMQACIDYKETPIFQGEWPTDLLSEEEGIWVRDMFWDNHISKEMTAEKLHDLEIIGIQSFDLAPAILKDRILATRSMKWLIQKLRDAPNNELFFGEISANLHDDIKDDPSPYRKDIKMLVQNLLSYCETYLPDELEITRPNYSQKVRLLVAG